jgi:hypothetical protein
LRIFVSYRREDSAAYAGRLYDALAAHFGSANVFMDIDTISPGTDFVDVIDQALDKCDVLLAVIGTRWLTTATADGQRRLDNPEDFVRLEIEKALSRGIRVVPVLVGDASMPATRDLPSSLVGLARRHAFDLSHGRWHTDVLELIRTLETIGTRRPQRNRRLAVMTSSAVAVVGVALLAGVLINEHGSSKVASGAPLATRASTQVSRPHTSSTRMETSTTLAPSADAWKLVDRVLNAEVNRDWTAVRALYAPNARYTDANLTKGYADLVNQRTYPADAGTLLSPNVWELRFTLVAHNLDGGQQSTRSWCEDWRVDLANQYVTTVQGAEPLTSAPMSGWLDPPYAPTCR